MVVEVTVRIFVSMTVVTMLVVTVDGFQMVVVSIASTWVVIVLVRVLLVGRQVLPVLQEVLGWP